MAYGVTPHGGYNPESLKKHSWRKHLMLALLEERFLRHAAWIHAVGASEIQDILRLAPRARAVDIPIGQEPIPAPTAPPPVVAERPVIGFCGRLAIRHKGLDILIEGFAAYRAKGGTGELWMIGDGEDRRQLEQLAAQSGVAERVRFFGACPEEEKLTLTASFDAFVHSSRWEGLPASCLEAAEMGKPMLVSRETNLARYVEDFDAGLVLDETSAAGVERALLRLLQLYRENRLQRLGDNARQLVQSEFQWEKNVRRFVAAIREAVSAS
jgi:glycosyltransferase involved in cell wall biosynthesis